MGKFFGRHVTKRIGINELACGKGSVGVRETYDTYFFGIRTSRGKTEDKCIKKSLVPSTSDNSNFVNFNSTIDKIEKIALRKFTITRTKTTKWYRWTCKGDSSKTGVTSSRSSAVEAGKKACGKAEVVVDNVLMTKMKADFELEKAEA